MPFCLGARFLRNWLASTKFYVCLVAEKMREEKSKQIIIKFWGFLPCIDTIGILYYVGSRIVYT